MALQWNDMSKTMSCEVACLPFCYRYLSENANLKDVKTLEFDVNMESKIAVIYIVMCIIHFAYLYEDADYTTRFHLGPTGFESLEFEPIVTKDKEKTPLTKNLVCEEFTNYAVNCTLEAALIYNSSRRSPPMPAKMNDWCRAIRHLTNCAIDWNSECKTVTESHFNEESIKGHMHVVNNVCDDEWLLARYDDLPPCIELVNSGWESCYTVFKTIVGKQKNLTQEWTHYATHFHLCCARMRFRRCTLDVLFDSPARCEKDQAVTLQKFSVIISEGDVYQDCDLNVMYQNCPGGDPRPSSKLVAKLMSSEPLSAANVIETPLVLQCVLVIFASSVNY